MKMDLNFEGVETPCRDVALISITYAGLTLTVKEVQALFRFEKARRARVAKEMRRVANVVANRAGKKDPVFKRPVKTKGPRKTSIERGPYTIGMGY